MIKINSKNTYLPIALRQGSCEKRLEKATELTKTFYTQLQDAFKYGDVNAKGLKTMFKNTIKHPILVDIIPDTRTGNAVCSHFLNDSGETIGYIMTLPFSNRTNGLPKKNINILLRQTMMLFQEMLNPKYYKRVTLLLKHGIATIQRCSLFYNDKIYAKQPLLLDELNTFLKGKKAGEKIDSLQFFRHNIIKEINAQKFLKKDKEEYHLIPKLRMINERLKKEIETVRNKTKKSVLAKNSNTKFKTL